jgi:hypothetical protein
MDTPDISLTLYMWVELPEISLNITLYMWVEPPDISLNITIYMYVVGYT